MEDVSKPKFLGFDKPIFSDWAIIVFGLFAFANGSSVFQDYSRFSGLTAVGSLAFFIDLAFALFVAYVETLLIILLPRRFIRKRKQKNAL